MSTFPATRKGKKFPETTCYGMNNTEQIPATTFNQPANLQTIFRKPNLKSLKLEQN